jgi:hypothetical protein
MANHWGSIDDIDWTKPVELAVFMLIEVYDIICRPGCLLTSKGGVEDSVYGHLLRMLSVS